MDATTRQAQIDRYGSAYDLLQQALRRFPKEMWHFRASAQDWTIHEIVLHITDSEANSYVRCRRGIAEPGSTVLGYDETTWAKALHYHDQSIEDAVELFRFLRGNTYKLIKTLPESTWANTMNHTENGVMTLDDWLDIYARHVSDHVDQMGRVFAAWQQQQQAQQ
jgi:hypothetical protein